MSAPNSEAAPQEPSPEELRAALRAIQLVREYGRSELEGLRVQVAEARRLLADLCAGLDNINTATDSSEWMGAIREIEAARKAARAFLGDAQKGASEHE